MLRQRHHQSPRFEGPQLIPDDDTVKSSSCSSPNGDDLVLERVASPESNRVAEAACGEHETAVAEVDAVAGRSNESILGVSIDDVRTDRDVLCHAHQVAEGAVEQHLNFVTRTHGGPL